jgi:hypothetical protein
MLPQKIAFGSIHVMARPLAEQRAEGAAVGFLRLD